MDYKLPPTVKSNQVITAAAWNFMIECLKQREVNVGAGICRSINKDGVMVYPGRSLLRRDEPPVPKRHPFEVYYSGQKISDLAPMVYVAWGTVCRGDEKNTASEILIKSLDDLFQFGINYVIYLKCIFESTGVITSVSLHCDSGWSGFPMSYVDGGGGANSNTWYHPIARYRLRRTSKDKRFSESLSKDPEKRIELKVDSGEEPIFKDCIYTIAQLTNTHLVGQQQCMTDGSSVTRTAWKLVPGPGAVTGKGS